MNSNPLCSTMPQSMHKQSANQRRRLRKGIDEQQHRKKALNLLREKRSIRYVADACSISKSTAGRIAHCLKKDDKAQLSCLLNPVDFHRGRRTVWHASQATQLNKKIKEAAENGFAVDASGMKFVLQQICNDGRRSYQHGAQSSAAIRTYRAKNRDISYRHTENMDADKLRAENHDRIESLAHRLREIATNHAGIFDNPLQIWNLDETHVNGEFGERVKGFSGVHSYHSGFTAVKKGPGRHMTAVIASAASGHLALLFVIASGVNVMQSWTTPLDKTSFTSDETGPHWLTNQEWLTGDVVIRCTENGSVTCRRYLSSLIKLIATIADLYSGHSPLSFCLTGTHRDECPSSKRTYARVRVLSRYARQNS